MFNGRYHERSVSVALLQIKNQLPLTTLATFGNSYTFTDYYDWLKWISSNIHSMCVRMFPLTKIVEFYGRINDFIRQIISAQLISIF